MEFKMEEVLKDICGNGTECKLDHKKPKIPNKLFLNTLKTIK